MTIISTLLFILSTVGVLGFACWDNDIEIPFFYSFGQLEAHWWFNDKLKPGKPHLESHDKDGPPLVARTTTGGAIIFPYPSQPLGGATVTDSWDDSLKMQSTYTPINGLYGVSNQKESDRTHSTEYYPNASDPADYIVNRLIGPHADWSELEDMGDKLKIYNTKVFKDGTPFKSAVIGGPHNQNDPRWATTNDYQSSVPGYTFMPPLTSTGAGTAQDQSYYPRSVNDYSGAEYSADDPAFAKSIESETVLGFRNASVYQEDKNAYPLSPSQSKISAWPGEASMASQDITQSAGSTGYIIQSAYHDSQYDGANISNTKMKSYGWGLKGATTPAAGGYYPGGIQKDYILTQLSQENPISSIPAHMIPQGMGTGPVINSK